MNRKTICSSQALEIYPVVPARYPKLNAKRTTSVGSCCVNANAAWLSQIHMFCMRLARELESKGPTTSNIILLPHACILHSSSPCPQKPLYQLEDIPLLVKLTTRKVDVGNLGESILSTAYGGKDVSICRSRVERRCFCPLTWSNHGIRYSLFGFKNQHPLHRLTR